MKFIKKLSKKKKIEGLFWKRKGIGSSGMREERIMVNEIKVYCVYV